MPCLSPINIENKSARRPQGKELYVQVPCGRCPSCVQKHAHDDTFRLKEEFKDSLNATFITLTYDQEHYDQLPKYQGMASLNPEHHTLFMKKLRSKIKRDNPIYLEIRYFMCGEYGDRYERPHFHYIIFDLPQDMIEDPSIIAQVWGKGRVDVQVASSASMGYVAGYVNKKLLKAWNPQDERKPEFTRRSQGIGKGWIKRNQEYYVEREIPYMVNDEGRKTWMPRYYRDKIYTPQAKERIRLKSIEWMEENKLTEQERLTITKYKIERAKAKLLAKPRDLTYKYGKDKESSPSGHIKEYEYHRSRAGAEETSPIQSSVRLQLPWESRERDGWSLRDRPRFEFNSAPATREPLERLGLTYGGTAVFRP